MVPSENRWVSVTVQYHEQVTKSCHIITPLSPAVFQQSSEGEVHFDVEIAIKVLRQAGYHSHAVFLAEKHMHHEWYLKIQLEDLKVKKPSRRTIPSKCVLFYQLFSLSQFSTTITPLFFCHKSVKSNHTQT